MLDNKLTNELFKIIKQAGNIALSYYDLKIKQDIEVQLKQDNSPVTIVDLKINNFLMQQLKKITPDFAIISEEQNNGDIAKHKLDKFWIIDPLDGTKHFINHKGQFSIMLAAFVKNHPIYSLIYSPLDHNCYIATVKNLDLSNNDNYKFNLADCKSYKILDIDTPQNFIELDSRAKFEITKPIRVTHGHRNNMDAIYRLLNPKFSYEFIPYGSAGLKGGLVAEGKADIYISPHEVGLWDIAPAQALIEHSGGIIRDLRFKAIDYSGNSLCAPPFFIGRDASWNWQEILNLD